MNMFTVINTLTSASEIALSLSAKDRATLAHALIHSLDETVEEGVERAWDQELERRVARAETGEGSSRDAFEVLGEIKARYRA